MSWRNFGRPVSSVEITQPGDVVPLIIIGGGILSGLLWLIRAQITMAREFKPNGGSSLRDAVQRIERDILEMRARLDKHIDNH